MCGISGKLYFDPARPVEYPVLERMNAVLAHRGPDDAGIYCQGAVGLAHRRLSIIDLSPAGHQPMTNEDGQAGWLVPSGDPAALAESIGALLRTPTLRDRLGDAARAIVAEQFDIQRVVTQYLSLYGMLHP